MSRPYMADASILPELKARHAAHVQALKLKAKLKAQCECGLIVNVSRLPLHRHAQRHWDALAKVKISDSGVGCFEILKSD